MFASTNFTLQSNCDDPLGLVRAAQRIARRRKSGIKSIMVGGHDITLVFSRSVSRRRKWATLRKVLLRAGYSYKGFKRTC